MFKTRGVTLIEVLVVVALMGFIAAIGIPSMQTTIAINQSRTTADAMRAAIGQARQAATNTGQVVVLCGAAQTGISCATSWDYGWLICAQGNSFGGNCSSSNLIAKGVIPGSYGGANWISGPYNAQLWFNNQGLLTLYTGVVVNSQTNVLINVPKGNCNINLQVGTTGIINQTGTCN